MEPTLERRLKAKDKLIAELLEAIKQIIDDFDDRGNVTTASINKAERAIRKAKGDDTDDLIKGLERAADLFDDIQDRKKELGID